MQLVFGGNFFGVADGDVGAFDDKFHASFSEGKFHINCGLGECGMVPSINDDGSTLRYDVQISTNTLTPLNIVDGDQTLTLYQGAAAASLDASCEYSTSVEITSSAFDVQARVRNHWLVFFELTNNNTNTSTILTH